MEEFEGIGQAIKILRTRQGLLQKDVSGRSGISKTLISGYETGKTEPSLTSLSRLLQALDCDRFDLINALEEANQRPAREFPVLRDQQRQPGAEIIDALGLKGLGQQEQSDFLCMLDAFRSWFEHCRALSRRMEPRAKP